VPALLNLSVSLAAKGELAEALAQVERALQAEPGNAVARRARERLQATIRRAEEARAEAEAENEEE
jgi:hypothetical protein